MTIEIGGNLQLVAVLAIVAVLVVEWWAFRLKGRR
jgi:hypothetical protein